jgi:hypothetical protein
MGYLNQIFENNLPNYLYASKVIQVKNDIYSFLQKKIIELISIVNNNGRNELVNPLLNILLEVNNLIRTREKFLSNIIELIDNNIKKENEKIVSQSNNFIKENSKLKYLVNEKEREYNILETNNKLLEDKFDQINNENLDMMQKIINKSGNPKKKNLKIEDLDSNIQTKSKKYSSQNNTTSPKNFNDTLNKNQKIISPTRQRNNTEITIKNYHNLSKDQLLNLIENIYRSKSICNYKCEQSKKPIETMEQHLYEYLNQRYGLKNLTIEYASSIIKAIKDYSNISSEILLFGMILKNELEENSINISNQIKKVINDSLTYYLSQKYPSKDAGEINSIVSKKGFIDEDIWNKIIDVFFLKDKEAAEIVREKINNFIHNILEKSNVYMTLKSDLEMTRDEKILMEEIQNMQKKITYGDLFNILLDYHIRTRSKYLKNFKNLFKKFDSNNDGILTKKELIQLIRELNIFDESDINQNIDLLLRKLPFCEKYNSFSFSEVLALFDEEKLTNKNGEIISILDAIAK